MRFILILVFFGIQSLSGQYLFEGQVAGPFAENKVYLSLVDDYRKTGRVYLDQIVQVVQADSAGHFSFNGNQLPKSNRIYRIHVDGCKDGAYSKNHFLQDCNATESLLFIANNQDTISMPLGDYNQSFCEIVSTNPNSKALFEIEAMKEEMILDFMVYDSRLRKELLYKEWFKKFNDFGNTYSDPLIGVYCYAFLSDRSSETHDYYMNNHQNIPFYNSLLTRLEKTHPNATYTAQYKNERYADKTITAAMNGEGKFKFGYLLAILTLLGLGGLYYVLQKNKHKHAKINYAKELTPQEQRITALIKEGKSNKEIASELFVSLSTVKTHINNIYKKLGMRSRSELLSKK